MWCVVAPARGHRGGGGPFRTTPLRCCLTFRSPAVRFGFPAIPDIDGQNARQIPRNARYRTCRSSFRDGAS
eukprot:1966500-Rhodomonas_salina.1